MFVNAPKDGQQKGGKMSNKITPLFNQFHSISNLYFFSFKRKKRGHALRIYNKNTQRKQSERKKKYRWQHFCISFVCQCVYLCDYYQRQPDGNALTNRSHSHRVQSTWMPKNYDEIKKKNSTRNTYSSIEIIAQPPTEKHTHLAYSQRGRTRTRTMNRLQAWKHLIPLLELCRKKKKWNRSIIASAWNLRGHNPACHCHRAFFSSLSVSFIGEWRPISERWYRAITIWHNEQH